jgi:signal transduction histidine kinase
MTRRILASFLVVLIAVLAAVVVPLGVVVTVQLEKDFRAGAVSAARAVAALAEERLDDRAPSAPLAAALGRLAAQGYGVTVVDTQGGVVAHAGRPIPRQVLDAAQRGKATPALPDRVTVSAAVTDTNRRLGLVVLARDTAPLTRRLHLLWLAIAAGGAIALIGGTAVGLALGHWIARPLRSLVAAARGVGKGDSSARADDSIGPPDLRAVAGAFNDTAARVSDLLEMQRGMTAEVSHQLRTPLAALRLRLELLSGELGAVHRNEVEEMTTETNRLARLVDGLLVVARAEATFTQPEATDLKAVAHARLGAWEPLASERRIELRLEGADTWALVAPGHVEQILDNLLDNALEAVPAGGRITVSVQSANGTASLVVADTGPGMSVERRARALDRYVTDRAGDGGTGLGLAVVGRLVSADHGRTELLETPGGGLTVAITLLAVRR